MKSLKILVTIGKGVGNMIEGTPLCHALYLLGHEIDLFIESPHAEQYSTLFSGWSVLGKVYTRSNLIEFSNYDLGICCQGKSRISKRFPAGLCAEIRFHDLLVHQQSETDANLSIARILGYQSPAPPGHAEKSHRAFDLRPNTVVVHAGCAKKAIKKRWGHWPDICQMLTAAGYPVVIVGTDQDRSDENWEAGYHTEFNLSLTDLASLMSQASFYLGNDSGIGHIASALGLPGLLLFGTTDPRYFAPNSKVMQTLSVAKDPLPNQTVRAWDRTQSLTPLLNVHDVWHKVKQLLANPAKDPPRPLPPAKRIYPPAPISPQFLDDPVEARIYKNASHSLLSVFSESARKLMEGQDRKIVAAEAARKAGHIHIATSFQLLKLRVTPKASPSLWAEHRGFFHARRGIRAGYVLTGCLLSVAHNVISLFQH